MTAKSRKIDSVAVLGGGTMGIGIAALCANRGHRVLLLDRATEGEDRDAVARAAVERMVAIRPPALEDPANAALIDIGNFDDHLGRLADHDWICEAIVEDLGVKRALFEKVEAARRDGSIVTTNTSGIPLAAISQGMPDRFRRDVAVTHFFNPVALMKLMELVPGRDTTADVIAALADFCGGELGKGVVHAKDTVNFIGNRIGCFWMLAGLHKGAEALRAGLDQETMDALMGTPVGLPSTGLYGLIDLIGLDVMDLVGKNLAANLPSNDAGRAFVSFPAAERAMLERGQLGRKSRGGFYRLVKGEDGSKSMETFDLTAGAWRPRREVALPAGHDDPCGVMFGDTPEGRFAWELMGATLCYAADLVPEISDDVVNVDRAMRWGFNWRQGPFEMLDALGPNRVIARLEAEGRPVPRMLETLRRAGAPSFYRAGGTEALGPEGDFLPVR